MNSIGLEWSVPIVVAALTAISGLIAYAYQKHADRNHQLIEMRRSAYRNYLSALINQVDIGTPETQNKLHLAEIDLVVVASDAVVTKYSAFQRYMADTSRGQERRDAARYKGLLANCLLEMRKDCFEQSKFGHQEALSVLPFE